MLDCKAARATAATEVAVMEREAQYFDLSHSESDFAPLLALHPMQQSAMFSRVMILASFTMCSQEGLLRRSR